MTERLTYAPLTLNDRAEGSPPSGDVQEPISPTHTGTVPAIKISSEVNAPSGETGVVAAVITAREGKDNVDVQDASLTSAEALPSPQPVMAVLDRTPMVLIVEDTTELAEVIQATLERMNMTTVHESHGLKALSKLDELTPDLVLLDIGLPDMTGWKLLEALKEKHKESGKMPVVIVITAYGDPANRLMGKLQGVHTYLIKPFTSDEVERVVMQAIGSSSTAQ